MQTILIILGLLVALVLVILAIGMTLPRTHRVSSRVTLHQPPADVWGAVRNLASLVGTWRGLKSARRLDDVGGKEVWEQIAGGFTMRLVIEHASPPRGMVTRIDAAPDAPFGGTWTYDLTPASGGTQVTVTEDGYVSNPIFRVMMKLMGEHSTLDGYLKGLGAKFGEKVKPEHVA